MLLSANNLNMEVVRINANIGNPKLILEKMKCKLSDDIDQEQAACFVQSDLDLHCLQKVL